MAGIYIHIPFCKQACHYCNFHFSTSLRSKNELLECILQEITLQKNYFRGTTVETLYFGGGTPSLLSAGEINQIIAHVFETFSFTDHPEITFEANPDDLTPEKVRDLQLTEINRLSIGIQSFSDADLRFMNRAHNSKEAADCIDRVLDAGYDNFSVDLIYGTPTLSNLQWKKNIEILIAKNVPHISCYALTVEEKTALDHFIKTKKAAPIDDEKIAGQFKILTGLMSGHGYDHYEISNFCLPGKHAKHNSSYWQNKIYLGIGPSAHSFNGRTRQWNVANNMKYIKAIHRGEIPFEREELTPEDLFNEFIMTGLRTKWGIEIETARKRFDKSLIDDLIDGMSDFIEKGWIIRQQSTYLLTSEGKLFADHIMSELFIVS